MPTSSAPAPRSSSPRRRSTTARSPASPRPSRPTRATTRRASTSPLRSAAPAAARRRSTTCSNRSAWIASGTTRPCASSSSSCSTPGVRATNSPWRAAVACRRSCSRDGGGRAMSANEPYSLADLPDRLPIFPLGGALLLPRAHLPLNIFEPRYLAMFNDALASDRLIGMVQPDSEEALALQDVPTARPSVYEIGCAGRITAFAETDDGRMLVTLTGVARFRIVEEHPTVMPYRLCTVDFSPFENDL